jgi:small subunit ribosomal protein S13
MVRLLGVDLPKNKKIEYALTSLYGIGLARAKKLILNSNINPDSRTNTLTIIEIATLRNNIEIANLKLEGDLKRFNNLNIKRLININCYRGSRHRLHLPLRGQRTRTNARSNKGSKQTTLNKKK